MNVPTLTRLRHQEVIVISATMTRNFNLTQKTFRSLHSGPPVLDCVGAGRGSDSRGGGGRFGRNPADGGRRAARFFAVVSERILFGVRGPIQNCRRKSCYTKTGGLAGVWGGRQGDRRRTFLLLNYLILILPQRRVATDDTIRLAL